MASIGDIGKSVYRTEKNIRRIHPNTLIAYKCTAILTGIDFFKGVLVSALVGVVLDGHLSVGFLDGLLVGILFDSQRLVQFCGIHVRRGTASTPRSPATAVAKVFCKGISTEKHSIVVSKGCRTD